MNPISNIWNQPKTSVAGLLIGIVTIAGVLSQQGVSLGKAGSGTVVMLVSGIASALLGLLARDPAPSAPASNSTAKLGVIMLCALLITGAMPMAGCSGTTVAQDIVNWTPALESAVATVDSTASLLAPAETPIFTAATAGFDAASNVLVAQAKAYLANPNATVLQQLQTAVVTFQQQVNASLLAAAKITNPNSQTHVLASINGVATIVTAIFALVTSISTKAQVAQMATQSTVKLASVEPYLDRETAAALVAAHYGEPVRVARSQVAQLELNAARAGF